MREKNNSILKPNKLAAIAIYVIILFVVSGFITMGIGAVIGYINDLDINKLMLSYTATDFIGYEPEYIKANAISQGWGNFIGYFLSFVAVVFFMRDDLINDFNVFKEKKKYYLLYSLIALIAFMLITLVVEAIIANFVEDSANQAVIEAILNNGGAIPMVLATVILAPVVEELIYRKAIFYYGNKYSVACSYIVSILLFTLPHMLSTDMSNMAMWLLQCVPYALSGGLLCLIYHKSNYNIYTVILVHMTNNLIACVLAFI